MADIDWGKTEEDLKKAAADRGVTYDASDLEDIKRNASYTRADGSLINDDPSKFFNVAIAKYDARSDNKPGQEGKDWGTATTSSGAPAQTLYTVNSNGSLTRRPGAPTPFTIPRIGAPGSGTTSTSTTAAATDRGTTRNPFTGNPATDYPWDQGDNGVVTDLERAMRQIADAYKTYLGGQGTVEEYLAHLGGGHAFGAQNIQYAIYNIANSDEAKAYAAWKTAHPATPPATTAPPATTSTTPPPAPPASHPYDTNVNTHPTFDHPTQRLVEDTALNRMTHLTNPEAGSGTALYEDYLKQLADILKGAPFSDTEMAQLKNSVYQDLLKERDATQQRWLETVSQRGLSPSSGPALEGLKQIDGHFEQIRSAADSQFALAAIQQRQSNQLQVASIYGTLAGNEEGRLDKAFTYSQVPYGLFNDSFQRNLQLVGAGGSPGSTVSSILGIVNAINQNNQISSQNRTSLTTGLLQYLGYLFPDGAGA